MKNARTLLIACLMMLIALTACTDQAHTVRINADHSIDYKVEVTFTPEAWDQLLHYDVLTPDQIQEPQVLFTRLTKDMTERSFTASPIDDGTVYGMTYTKSYPDAPAFNREITELYQEGVSGLNVMTLHQKSRKSEGWAFGGSVGHVIDKELMDYAEDYPNYEALLYGQTVEATLSVEFPERITLQENGLKDGDNIINWRATRRLDEADDQLERIETNAATTVEASYTMYIVTGVVFAVAGVLAFLVLKKQGKLTRKKRRSNNRKS